MKQSIAQITLVVKEYDEAIAFYTEKLDFNLIEDTHLGGNKRWVLVAPPGSKECSLLLSKADSEEQDAYIGDQTGGRVFLFLYTDDIRRDYNKMVERGVDFERAPKKESYGTVAVFKDLYGNLWDLIEPANKND